MRRGLGTVLTVALLLASVAGAGIAALPSHSPAAGSTVEPSPLEERAAGPSPAFHPAAVPAPAVTVTTVVIEPNGTVSNASAPITESGAVYTVTASFAGQLLIERNNSRLTSDGVSVSGVVSSLAAVEVYGAYNVSVDHLAIGGTGTGLLVADAQRVGVVNVTVGSTNSPAIDVLGSELTSIANASVVGTVGTGILVQGSEQTVIATSNETGRPSGIVVDDSLNASVVTEDLTDCPTGITATASSDLTLRSDDLAGTGTGIGLYDTASVSLEGDVAVGPQVALIANGATFVNVTGETYSDAATAVELTQSYGVDLTENNLTGNDQGVVAVDSGGLTLSHNNLSRFASVGIELVAVVDGYLSLNSASASTSPSGVAIETVDSTGVVEFDNTVDTDPTSIRDVGGVNLTLSDDIFVDAGSAGAALELENDSQITTYQDDFTNASAVAIEAIGTRASVIGHDYVAGAALQGIEVLNGSGVTVTSNTLLNAGPVGISLGNSSDCVVWGNNLRHTGSTSIPLGTGIWAAFDAGATLAFNNVTGAVRALALTNTTSGSVLDNNASASDTGLMVAGVADSLVVANNFWNDNRSLDVQADVNVAVYHNNFGNDNGWTVGPGPDSIVWAAGYPEGGNFWSNHTGPDAKDGPAQDGVGSDGIVDTPVPVGPAGTDPYPLTTPWIPVYAVFSESGLLLGTHWSLMVNGARYTSVAPSPVLFAESNAANATVAWTVLPVAGFTLLGVAVGGPWPEQRGANLSYALTFNPDRFNASFQEFGLAPGTPWSFVVNGQPEGGETADVAVSLPNGTYSYLAGGVTGYNLTVGSGEVTVAGPGAVVLIVYIANPNSSASSPASHGTSTETVEALAAGLGLAGFAALALLGLYLRERRRAGPPPPLREAGAAPSSNVREDGRRTG